MCPPRFVCRCWPAPFAVTCGVWAWLIRPPFLLESELFARTLFAASAVALVAVMVRPTTRVRATTAGIVGWTLLMRGTAILIMPGPLVWQTRVAGGLCWLAIALALVLLLQDRGRA